MFTQINYVKQQLKLSSEKFIKIKVKKHPAKKILNVQVTFNFFRKIFIYNFKFQTAVVTR